MQTKPTAAELNQAKLVTEQVVAEVMKGVQAPTKTHEELIVERVNKIAMDSFQEFRQMHNIAVVPMTKQDATEHIQRLYKDKYTSWNKDDLMNALVLVLAVLAVESLHNELI